MTSRSEWQARRAAMEVQPGRSSASGPRPTPILRTILRIGGALTRWSGISRLTRGGAAKIAVTDLAMSCPGLPTAFDGFTVLHLSDTHLESMPSVVVQAVACLNGLPADLAVITGDFQTGDHDAPDPDYTAALLRPLIAAIRVRHGIYGILGNHDSHSVVAPLEKLGIRMLVNEPATISQGGAELHLVGLDDPHAFYTEDAVRALRAATAGFRIALVHTPELADVAARAGYGLYLAGHTHGGQICLPGGRPLLTGLDTHHALASGLWRIGAMQGYTNRGLGIGGMPIRINCPAEIARITLRSVSASPTGDDAAGLL